MHSLDFNSLKSLNVTHRFVRKSEVKGYRLRVVRGDGEDSMGLLGTDIGYLVGPGSRYPSFEKLELVSEGEPVTQGRIPMSRPTFVLDPV